MNNDIFHFQGFYCDVVGKRYSLNNARCIILVDHETGELIATATVNMPLEQDHHDESDIVFIKDYSENSGILLELVNEGFVDAPHREISQGFITIHVCTLTPKAMSLWSD